MDKKFLFFLFSMFTLSSAFSQTFDWVKSFGNAQTDMSFSTAIDASGNVYMGGFFYQTVDFDPDPSVTENKTSFGAKDMFLSKFDASGSLLWVKQFGGSKNEEIRALSVDANNNLIVTGYFEGTCDFDPGTGIDNHTAGGVDNTFIMKLNSAGVIQWKKFFTPYLNNKFASCRSTALSVDNLGNIYTTGLFSNFVNFLGKPYSGGTNHIFITKLDPSGNRVWARRLQPQSECMPTSILIQNQPKYIFLSGYHKGTINVRTNDPALGIYQNQVADGGIDFFLLKIDDNGDYVSVNSHDGSLSSSDEEIIYDLTLGDGNKIYSVGYLKGGIDLIPDNPTVYEIVSGGQVEAIINNWGSTGNGGNNSFSIFKVENSNSGTNTSVALSITSDPLGNLYYTGFFEGTVDFDPSTSNTVSLTSSGGKDMFICKMDKYGALIWAKKIGGPGNEVGKKIVFGSSKLYVTGNFEGTVDFDFGTGTTNQTATGLEDIFIIRLTP